jgi:hypothetical protein
MRLQGGWGASCMSGALLLLLAVTQPGDTLPGTRNAARCCQCQLGFASNQAGACVCLLLCLLLGACCSGDYWVYITTNNPLLQGTNKTVILHLTVVSCPLGYATPSRDNCNACIRGYFSLNPNEQECSLCPPNAQCAGIHFGWPQIWPTEGWWHSAPHSIQMHR